jgi:hypothetical protein
MKVSGKISDKIVYIHSHSKEVGFKWDDDDETKEQNKRLVTPAFCAEADNTKSIKTGKQWAKGRLWHAKDTYDTLVEERDNKPIRVEIVSKEHRSQGGVVWKVVSDGFWFDLRNDVLLDVMLNSKIENGKIKDKFIWAKLGSQMRLVRIGSELHQALIDSTNLGEAKVLTEYVVGQLYESKTQKYIYMGRHTSKVNNKKKSGHLWMVFKGDMWLEDTLKKTLENPHIFDYYLKFISKPAIKQEGDIKWDIDWDLITERCKEDQKEARKKQKKNKWYGNGHVWEYETLFNLERK